MANTKIRIVNQLGKDVERNGTEQGEVIVKGSGVITKNETKHTTINGWLYTGDIGTMDENGKIKIIQQIPEAQDSHARKDLSIYEIEKAFNSHSAIVESAVIATPHIEQGDTYHAFIVLHQDEKVSETELIDFLRKKFDQPALLKIMITFTDELPRTASGKILKLQLHDKAES